MDIESRAADWLARMDCQNRTDETEGEFEA
jgi:hypothetical protein